MPQAISCGAQPFAVTYVKEVFDSREMVYSLPSRVFNSLRITNGVEAPAAVDELGLVKVPIGEAVTYVNTLANADAEMPLLALRLFSESYSADQRIATSFAAGTC